MPSFGTDSAQSPAARETQIVVVGSDDNLKWLEALVGQSSVSFSRVEHFEPADLLRASRGTVGSLRCWVDLRDATRARIYFAARAGERFLVRDLELSGSFDELDRESMSQVLASSWSALFDDEQAGLSRADTQALLAKRADAAANRTSTSLAEQRSDPTRHEPAPPRAFVPRMRVQAFYAQQAFADQRPIQGPGLTVSGGLQSHRELVALWLEGQYRFPQTELKPQIGVRLESFATRAGLELGWPLSANLNRADREFSIRAGAGADFTHLTPEPGTAESLAALTAARWSTAFVFTSSVGASLPLYRGIALAARLFVDVLPTRVKYDLHIGGGTDTQLSPWNIRPGVALAIEMR